MRNIGMLTAITDCNEKVCLRCNITKPEKAYQLDKRGRRNVCMECRWKSERLLKKLRADWDAANPQGRPTTCELCGKQAKRLVLDHCHETEQPRGWLCDQCNIALGYLGDNVAGLEAAIRYLQR